MTLLDLITILTHEYKLDLGGNVKSTSTKAENILIPTYVLQEIKKKFKGFRYTVQREFGKPSSNGDVVPHVRLSISKTQPRKQSSESDDNYKNEKTPKKKSHRVVAASAKNPPFAKESFKPQISKMDSDTEGIGDVATLAAAKIQNPLLNMDPFYNTTPIPPQRDPRAKGARLEDLVRGVELEVGALIATRGPIDLAGKILVRFGSRDFYAKVIKSDLKSQLINLSHNDPHTRFMTYYDPANDALYLE